MCIVFLCCGKKLIFYDLERYGKRFPSYVGKIGKKAENINVLTMNIENDFRNIGF